MNAPRAETVDRRSRVRGGMVLGLAATALVVFAQDALAKNGPPKSEQYSSVAQYRESIPTSEGPTLPGTGRSTSTPLPAPVAREIEEQGGSDAKTLVNIATKSELGAPPRRLPPKPELELPQVGLDKQSPGAQSGVAKQAEKSHAMPRALATSTGGIVSGSRGGHLLGLVIVLALIALTGLAAARRQRI